MPNREAKTITAMLHLYCRGKHGSGETLCTECEVLLGYALERIDKCPFGENKPACAKCRIHCFKQEMRAKIREVMRYSGPKMLFKHPLLTLHHLLGKRLTS